MRPVWCTLLAAVLLSGCASIPDADVYRSGVAALPDAALSGPVTDARPRFRDEPVPDLLPSDGEQKDCQEHQVPAVLNHPESEGFPVPEAFRVRQVFARQLDTPLRLVYDVAHNIVKVERYGGRDLCVHREGATRAFGPGNEETPERYRKAGQPVFIPGSTGTASYVLAGNDAAMERSFGSACHGAGRAMSRTAAKLATSGQEGRRQLAEHGIVVRCVSNAELAEEAPIAYKDVERVAAVVERAGLARRVARAAGGGDKGLTVKSEK